MHCLETNKFPYYPTDDVWRREEFSKFIQYQGNLWDDKVIKQTMHGLALSWLIKDLKFRQNHKKHTFKLFSGAKQALPTPKEFPVWWGSNRPSTKWEIPYGFFI